jgi:hypothetical protein
MLTVCAVLQTMSTAAASCAARRARARPTRRRSASTTSLSTMSRTGEPWAGHGRHLDLCAGLLVRVVLGIGREQVSAKCCDFVATKLMN